MRRSLLLRGLAAVLTAAAATTASAQDYAPGAAYGLWTDPPAGATDILPSFTSRVDDSLVVDGLLPFPIAYFGRAYTSLSVSTNGYVQFGGATSSTSAYAAFPQSAATDGACAPAWGALDGSDPDAHVYVWTDGAAPSRRFIVAWTNWLDAPRSGSMSMQVQFHEATGRIVFAYAPGWSATNSEAVGIDAVTSAATGNDARWATPDSSAFFTFTGAPPSDWQFDPADDVDEPNDVSRPVALGTIGLRRGGLVLARGDEDWFRFTVAESGGTAIVDMTYDAAFATTPALEVRTSAGGVLAQGSLVGGAGPFRAVTGPLDAGDYLVSVRHVGGRAVPAYSLQAYAPLTITAAPVVHWTIGRPFDSLVDIRGGVGACTLDVDDWVAAPPGLSLDGATRRLTGIPGKIGRYDFFLTCRDSGSPQHVSSVLQTIVVDAALDLRVGEFTAFALGKNAACVIPAFGGSAPFSLEASGGELPHGVSFASGVLGFDGEADTAGCGPVTITATDAAGSTSQVKTMAVVCVPVGAVELPAGDAAAGVWFDAVQGSVVTLSVATAKREARRPLSAVLLSPDGTTPTAAKVTAGVGKARLTRFVVPASGRYFLVLASDAGETTHLVAKAAVAPPTRGAGRADAFQSGDSLRVEVGALAGATLTFSAKPLGAGLSLQIQSLIDPDGTTLPVNPADVKVHGGSLTIAKTLGKSGTWTVLVAGAQGGPARVNWSWKVAQPRGGVYSRD